MEKKLPFMFSVGQILLMGWLVASSFDAPPLLLAIAAIVGGVLSAATVVLAFGSAGTLDSAGALVMFPDDPLSRIVPGAALLAYMGLLATVGGSIPWSAKQIGLVGLLVFFVAYFLAGLYLTFRASEPFVSRDTLDGNPQQ
jgi:hypothetical protein